MSGPKSGEALASTYGLRRSLDGLPRISEFWREVGTRVGTRESLEEQVRSEGC